MKVKQLKYSMIDLVNEEKAEVITFCYPDGYPEEGKIFFSLSDCMDRDFIICINKADADQRILNSLKPIKL